MMVLRYGSYEFSLGRWSTASTVLGIAIFIFLGQWQLERAAQKQALIEEYASRAQRPPIEIDGNLTSSQDIRYRQCVVHGQYDLQRQWLLDNRTHAGRAGYHVITPLHIDGSEVVVLVNRGWVPVGASRARLPDLAGPTGDIVVQGTIHPPPRVFQLAPDVAHDGNWPAVVQALNLATMAEQIGRPVLPEIVQLDPRDDYGFVREWKAIVGIGPDKHRAYALQWFTFAVVLLGIYAGVNTRRVGQ
jgi:surfeit locus 1 family protein